MRNVLASIVLLVTTNAAFAQDCPAPLKPSLRVEMYFGRSVQGGAPVSDRQWAEFVTQEMTPRLPGLTVVDAQGAWKDEKQMRERTKLVIVVLPDEPASREGIAAIASSYKSRFHQKSVGIVTQSACASFD
jgi:Protein of unknown function (DUF3574)